MVAINTADTANFLTSLLAASSGKSSLGGQSSSSGQAATSAPSSDLTSLLNSTTADLSQQTLGTPIQGTIKPFTGLGPVVLHPPSGGGEESDLEKLIADLTKSNDPSDAGLIQSLEAKLGQLVMQQGGNGRAGGLGGAGAPGGQGGAAAPASDPGNSALSQFDPSTMGTLMRTMGQTEVRSGMEDMGKGMQDLMSGNVTGAAKEFSEAVGEIKDGKQDEMMGSALGQMAQLRSQISQALESSSALDSSDDSDDSDSSSLPSSLRSVAQASGQQRTSAFDFGELNPKEDSLGIISSLEKVEQQTSANMV